MTHSVQRGLDAARSDADLAREAARRQRAKAEGRTTFGDPGSVNLNAVDSSLIVPPPTPNSGPASSSLGSLNINAVDSSLRVPADCVIEAEPLPLEKSVQHDVRELYEGAGCTVYNLSQARASKQTPGLSDMWVFHDGRGIAFWHESKRPGNGLSDAQRAFRDHCRATGTKFVSGGVEEAKIAVARWGLR